ncbi:MAG: hypothetical protein IJN85_04895 [Oscillospiraceae bacterium]|nr:hypothetical protein [Oscillospiraceae bacterium]
MKKIFIVSAIIAAMLTGCSEKTDSISETAKTAEFDTSFLGFKFEELVPNGEFEQEYYSGSIGGKGVSDTFTQYKTKENDAIVHYDEKGRFRKYLYNGDEDNPSGNLHEEELEKKCYELLEKTVPDPESYISSMGLNYGGTDATSYSANFEKINKNGLKEAHVGINLELDGDIQSIGVSYMDIYGIDYSEHEAYFEKKLDEEVNKLKNDLYSNWEVTNIEKTLDLRVVGENLCSHYCVTFTGEDNTTNALETILITRNLKED